MKKEDSRPRDHFGRFINTEKKSKGAGNIISSLIKTHESKDDETLIDVKITNPLHRIAQILQDIKTHQSTKISLSFTIPLIALPVFLLAAFQLGKVQNLCTPVFSSHVGTLRNINVFGPKDNPGIIANFIPFFTSTKKDFINQKKSILITSKDDVITVDDGENLDLSGFNNQPIIVSGLYSSCTKTLILNSLENISLK